MLLIFQTSLFFIDGSSGQEPLYWILFITIGVQLMYYFLLGFKRERILYSFWVRPSNIFILSLLIVNLQIILNVYLGLDSISSYLETCIYTPYVGKALIFGCIGISAFLLGNAIKTKQNITYRAISAPQKQTVFVWTLMSLLSFCVWVINIDILSFVTGMDYQGSGAATRETSPFAIFEVLFDVFVTINLATITRNNIIESKKEWSILAFLRSFPVLFLLIVSMYMILRLVSGDRGPVIYTGLMFFYSYLISTGKRIKLSRLLLLIIVGAFSMTLLNVIRGFRNPTESFSQKVERALEEMSEESDIKTISPFTHELAKSVNCNFIALHDIDKGITNYKYGAYNISELVIGIPGSNRVAQELFDIDLYRYATSEYLTISFLGKNYAFGLGTTALADFFLDFGIIGVILGMFFGGRLFKKIDSCIVSPYINIYVLIAMLKFSSMAIYIPRSSFSFVACRVIYIFIIFSFFYSLVSFFSYIKTLKLKYCND